MSAPTTPRPVSRWRGREELVMAGIVLALAAGLGYGTLTMEVPEGISTPGPRFFPTIITVGLTVLGILLTVSVFRSPRSEVGAGGSDDVEMSTDLLEDLGDIDTTSEIRVISEANGDNVPRAGTDWKTFLTVLGALIVFILILEPVGWIFSGTLLFWVISRALGSRRPLFDVGISLLVSSAIQLAFSAGLGLTLPSGILSGVFPWIS